MKVFSQLLTVCLIAYGAETADAQFRVHRHLPTESVEFTFWNDRTITPIPTKGSIPYSVSMPPIEQTHKLPQRMGQRQRPSRKTHALPRSVAVFGNLCVGSIVTTLGSPYAVSQIKYQGIPRYIELPVNSDVFLPRADSHSAMFSQLRVQPPLSLHSPRSVDNSLATLVKQGLINWDEAASRAHNLKTLEMLTGRKATAA